MHSLPIGYQRENLFDASFYQHSLSFLQVATISNAADQGFLRMKALSSILHSSFLINPLTSFTTTACFNLHRLFYNHHKTYPPFFRAYEPEPVTKARDLQNDLPKWFVTSRSFARDVSEEVVLAVIHTSGCSLPLEMKQRYEIVPPFYRETFKPTFPTWLAFKIRRESEQTCLILPDAAGLSLGWLSSHFHAQPRGYECINMRASAILAKEYLYL